MQKWCNSSALAMELSLFCISPLTWSYFGQIFFIVIYEFHVYLISAIVYQSSIFLHTPVVILQVNSPLHFVASACYSPQTPELLHKSHFQQWMCPWWLVITSRAKEHLWFSLASLNPRPMALASIIKGLWPSHCEFFICTNANIFPNDWDVRH